MESSPSPSNTDQSDRESLLDLLKTGMDDLSAAIESTAPQSPEEEKLQLRRYHELGYLANQYRKLKQDADLDRMDDRLELLEADMSAEED